MVMLLQVQTAAVQHRKDNAELAIVNLNGKVGKHANVGGFYTRVNGEDLVQSLVVRINVYKNIYGFNTDT